MKKIILTTLILMLLLSLFSCANNPPVDTTSNSELSQGSQAGNDEALTPDDSKENTENKDDEKISLKDFVNKELDKMIKINNLKNQNRNYYSFVDGGEFLGILPTVDTNYFEDIDLTVNLKDDSDSTFNTCIELLDFERSLQFQPYRLITTYEEFTSLAKNTEGFDADIFSENVVLYIEYASCSHKLGLYYKNLTFIDGKPYIVRDFNTENKDILCNGMLTTYDYYFVIPKSQIDKEMLNEGTITILHNSTIIYDHQAIQAPDNVNKELNTMWILKTNEELEDFCSFYGIEKPSDINFYDRNQMVAVLYTQRSTKYNEGEFGYYGFGNGNITFTYFTDGASDEEKSYVFDFIELPYSDLAETELLVNVKLDARILETIKPKKENEN